MSYEEFEIVKTFSKEEALNKGIRILNCTADDTKIRAGKLKGGVGWVVINYILKQNDLKRL